MSDIWGIKNTDKGTFDSVDIVSSNPLLKVIKKLNALLVTSLSGQKFWWYHCFLSKKVIVFNSSFYRSFNRHKFINGPQIPAYEKMLPFLFCLQRPIFHFRKTSRWQPKKLRNMKWLILWLEQQLCEQTH